MANIVISKTANSIKVNFNDYSTPIGFEEACYPLGAIRFYKMSDHVEAFIQSERQWKVSYATLSGSFTIDTVDGVAPTSNADLYTKLIALIA